MSPRPYQREAIDAALAHLVTGMPELGGCVQRTLLVLATGAGKTLIFSWLIQRWIQTHARARVLILVHSDELVGQTIDKLDRAARLRSTLEKAGKRADRECPVVVATIQTMVRRLAEWSPQHFDLIICDEAHLSMSQTWQTVLAHFEAKVIGCTATPFRTDKQDLLKFYDTICYDLGLFALIEQAYLARVVVRTVPLAIDLSELERRTRERSRPDYDPDDVDEALAPWYEAIAEAIVEYASGRQTLVFLPLIKASKQFSETLRSHGLTARHVDGNSPDRHAILAEFASGRFQALCNSNLLTTGYDEPSIGCIVNLRLTKSAVLASQILGRGTRLHAGKENLLYLDFLWQYDRLLTKPKRRAVRPADLLGASEQDTAAIQARLDQGEELDLLDARQDVAAARLQKLVARLASQTRARPGLFDALEAMQVLEALDLGDYEPLAEWESRPVKEGQAALLEKKGIDPATVGSRGLAFALIGKLIDRQDKGLCTLKQARALTKFGVLGAAKFTFDQARQRLDQLFGKGRAA